MFGRKNVKKEDVLKEEIENSIKHGRLYFTNNSGEGYLFRNDSEIYSFKFKDTFFSNSDIRTRQRSKVFSFKNLEIKAETIRKITPEELVAKLKPELDGANIDKKHTFLNTPEDKKAIERLYMRQNMTKTDREKEKFHVLDVTTNNGLYLTRKGSSDGYCFAKDGQLYSFELKDNGIDYVEREGTRKLITPEQLPDGIKIEQLKEEVRLLGEENPYIRYQPKTFLNRQEDRKLFGEFLYNREKMILDTPNINVTDKTASQANIQDLETIRKPGNTSLSKTLETLGKIQKNEKDVVCHENLDVAIKNLDAVAEHVKSLNERREKESLKSPTPSTSR